MKKIIKEMEDINEPKEIERHFLYGEHIPATIGFIISIIGGLGLGSYILIKTLLKKKE